MADSTVSNEELEHTAGGATTRDTMDAGVPMTPGQPDEPIGPEDAFGPGPKRGDYTDRLDSGPHMVTVAVSDDERMAEATKLAGKDGNPHAFIDEVPKWKLVPAGQQAADIGDVPGKGGVSTEEAIAAVDAITDPVAPAPPASEGTSRRGRAAASSE